MTNKLIHVAKLKNRARGEQERLLLLREVKVTNNDSGQNSDVAFCWFREEKGKEGKESKDTNKKEICTNVKAHSIEEAMRLAHKNWKFDAFETVLCGFVYDDPVRDEHGRNAYFYQMVASLNSLTGVYFDEKLGYSQFVKNNSREAEDLWRRLKSENRL